MTRARLAARAELLVNRLWYEQPRSIGLALLHVLLVPLSLLHGLWHRLRRPAQPLAVGAPVIVVGNLTAGGNGKTPFVLWLVERCRARGLNVGVVAAGAGGRGTRGAGPQFVTPGADPARVGDEAILLARSGVPVAVHRQRVRAARALVARHGCTLIIADDGLQHRPLPAAARIVMVDAARGFGNGWLLPAGPLREPAQALDRVQLVIGTGGAAPGVPVDVVMQLLPGRPLSLDGGVVAHWTQFDDRPVHALAGIGHPQRFFDTVRAHLAPVRCHAYPDHFAYRGCEPPLDDPGAVVLTTAKDAVHLQAVRQRIRAEVWIVPVVAEPEVACARAVEALVAEVLDEAGSRPADSPA